MVTSIPKQETFNQAYTHLMKQGQKSIKDSICLYRCNLPTGEVLKCGAGIFITDKQYCVDMEGNDINGCDLVRKAIYDNGHDIGLVKDIQFIHDNYSVKEWPEQFTLLADKHGFTIPEN